MPRAARRILQAMPPWLRDRLELHQAQRRRAARLADLGFVTSSRPTGARLYIETGPPAEPASFRSLVTPETLATMAAGRVAA